MTASMRKTVLPESSVHYVVARTLPESGVFEPLLQWHSPTSPTLEGAKADLIHYPCKYGVDPKLAKVTITWEEISAESASQPARSLVRLRRAIAWLAALR